MPTQATEGVEREHDRLFVLMVNQKSLCFTAGCSSDRIIIRASAVIIFVVGSERKGVETATLLSSITIRLGRWSSIDSQPHEPQGATSASRDVRGKIKKIKTLNRLDRKTAGRDGPAESDKCVVLPSFCAQLASWPSEKRLVFNLLEKADTQADSAQSDRGGMK